jgi:hypothetical protein
VVKLGRLASMDVKKRAERIRDRLKSMLRGRRGEERRD